MSMDRESQCHVFVIPSEARNLFFPFVITRRAAPLFVVFERWALLLPLRRPPARGAFCRLESLPSFGINKLLGLIWSRELSRALPANFSPPAELLPSDLL